MNLRKIFMIGWEYPPVITGGLGIACRGLARALASRGHDIQFLIPRLTGGEMQDKGVQVISPLYSIQHSIEFRKRYAKLLSRHQTPLPSAYPGAPDLVPTSNSQAGENAEFQMPGLNETLLKGGYGNQIYQEIEIYADVAASIVANGTFDIIHAHDWMTYPAGLRARASSGIPLVCHVHATEFDRSGKNVNQYVYDIERHAYHACDHIITVSNYTKQVLKKHYGVPLEKISAVHNAVEFELENQAISGHRPKKIKDHIVLFLGRITFQKGPDYFVRAARKVIDQMQNVRFVMVGTGDMYARMIELAADLGLGRYFHYTGFLDRKAVQRIYAMSDLYVMPSVSEPFGISPLEAMLHGVPVIVSRQSGVSEIIENCIKVNFWDVDALSESILKVLKETEHKTKLKQYGNKEVRRITWDAPARKTEQVYNLLLQNSDGNTVNLN